MIDSKFVQTEAYIGAQCIGNYHKKKPKPKAITRIKWEETKIETNRESVKKAAGRNSSKMVNSEGDMNSARRKEFRKCSNFLIFYALLSF